MNSRCFGRFLSAVDVVEIFDESGLDIQIALCKNNQQHNEVKKKNGKSGSISCFMNHRFINEKTKCKRVRGNYVRWWE
jgi:hypothetical protein